MILKRTNGDNTDFKKLVRALDESLKHYYKQEQSFYNELNIIEKIKNVVLIYNTEGICVGCGSFKKYADNEVEIKRMFVPNSQRNKGIATLILNELEKWSRELNFKKCILETLKEKKYAIAFYKKNGYSVVPNFGPYKNADASICFAKEI